MALRQRFDAYWRDVATADGSGDWSGVLHSTNDDGDFQVAKTRLKAATSTTADTSNTFAPGTTNVVIPASGDFELGLSVDLVAQWCKVFIDGVEVHEFTLLAGTGEFVTIRKVSLLAGAAGGGSQIKAEFEYVKFWYSTTVDGSEPAGAPDFEVSTVAEVNAPHPWKHGADAS